ncbi:hypothetical protein CLD22_22270 [Rubrivivax gelatinosus]|nr:hypothetical protein [Rubrivivax gelatinosus]
MLRRLLARLALLLVTTAAVAQPVALDEDTFTRHAAEQLQRTLSSGPVTVLGPLTLGVGEAQVNLDRIHAFCQRNTEGCAERLQAFLRDIVVSMGDAQARPSADALRIVLRSAAYVANARASIAGGSVPGRLDARPFLGDLMAVPVLDGERSVRLLGSQQRDELGLSEDQAFAHGLENLHTRLVPLAVEAQPVTPGRLGVLGNDFYQPSRLLLHDGWAQLAEAQGGVLVVAVPATDLLLYSADDSPAGLGALRALVADALARAPNPLSPALLRWRPDGWEPVR